MIVAFVLLTYRPDAPAGIERSIAALAAGLREFGHDTLILTGTAVAGPGRDRTEPGMLRLRRVLLPDPATEEDLLAILADPEPVRAEVAELLTNRGVDVVCWTDATWGLGYLAPAPAGIRTALMVRVPRADGALRQALSRPPDVVLTNSRFTAAECARLGNDTDRWAVVPNALTDLGMPTTELEREKLRQAGPVRVVARAEPHKGIRELIDAMPSNLGRPLEVVLAEAGFEYWPGMQAEVLAECRQAAAVAIGEVRILPPLPWRDVSPFLGGAALSIVASTSPETFGNAAAEALAVGTPVVAYDFGHVPELMGRAGSVVDRSLGPDGLWDAARRLLGDPAAYQQASAAGSARVGRHTPAIAAAAFLAAIDPAGGRQ